MVVLGGNGGGGVGGDTGDVVVGGGGDVDDDDICSSPEACSWRSDSTRCYPGSCGNELASRCACAQGFSGTHCQTSQYTLTLSPSASKAVCLLSNYVCTLVSTTVSIHSCHGCTTICSSQP